MSHRCPLGIRGTRYLAGKLIAIYEMSCNLPDGSVLRECNRDLSPTMANKLASWMNSKRSSDENHESKGASKGKDCHEPPTTIRTKAFVFLPQSDVFAEGPPPPRELFVVGELCVGFSKHFPKRYVSAKSRQHKSAQKGERASGALARDHSTHSDNCCNQAWVLKKSLNRTALHLRACRR